MRRSEMPNISTIHSGSVATCSAKYAFVQRFEGAYDPVERIRTLFNVTRLCNIRLLYDLGVLTFVLKLRNNVAETKKAVRHLPREPLQFVLTALDAPVMNHRLHQAKV